MNTAWFSSRTCWAVGEIVLMARSISVRSSSSGKWLKYFTSIAVDEGALMAMSDCTAATRCACLPRSTIWYRC